MNTQPCPFCGGTDTANDGHYVECMRCLARGPSACTFPVPSAATANATWNERRSTDRVRDAAENLMRWLAANVGSTADFPVRITVNITADTPAHAVERLVHIAAEMADRLRLGVRLNSEVASSDEHADSHYTVTTIR